MAQWREKVFIAYKVAQQARDHDRRDLAHAQAPAIDDLACRLEAQQRDGGKLGEVNISRVSLRRVPAVENAALDKRRRDDDEDGLHEEGNNQSSSKASATEDLVEPREESTSDNEESNRAERTGPAEWPIVLPRCT